MSILRIDSIATFFACLVICFLVSPAQAKYSGVGNGEPNSPYQISDANDMNEIGAHSEDWNSNFLLVNDINMSDYTGTQFNVIGNSTTKFTGVFDGNGHSISNFSYSTTGTDDIGIFSYVRGTDAVIKNLGLINPNVEAGTGMRVGPLFGQLYYGTVLNCWVKDGSISGHWDVGGLGGHNRDGIVSNCWSSAYVSADDHAGGLLGVNCNWTSGFVSDCFAMGNVLTDGDDIQEVPAAGGLVSWNIGTISNCYALGDVSGNNSYIGGLAGSHARGTISRCYSTGNVSGSGHLGGLIGSNSSDIINCFATGAVSGGDLEGGLVGGDDEGSYSKCFWDNSVNSEIRGIGNWINDPNVIAKSTFEMQKRSTFTDAGWDFVEIWNIGENQSYPYLRIYAAGDLNHDSQVSFYDFAIVADHWLEDK